MLGLRFLILIYAWGGVIAGYMRVGKFCRAYFVNEMGLRCIRKKR